MSKNYYTYYFRKPLRNVTIGQIVRICSNIHLENSCEICPFQKYGLCSCGLGNSELDRIIKFKLIYHRKVKS